MNLYVLNNEVERIIRHAEVKAVAEAIYAHKAPRLGETIDYFVKEFEPEHGTKAMKPYRVPVEQWHLDAAAQMLLPLQKDKSVTAETESPTKLFK